MGSLSYPCGGYLLWDQHGCTVGAVWLCGSLLSQALWDSVPPLSLLVLPGVCATTPGSLDPTTQQPQWEFWERETDNKTLLPALHIYLTLAFWGMQPADTLQSEWLTAFLPCWQPGMKKPPCLGGHPWLWVTGLPAAINLPAGFGRWTGIWDKHVDTHCWQLSPWADWATGAVGSYGSHPQGTNSGFWFLFFSFVLFKAFRVHWILTGGWSLL